MSILRWARPHQSLSSDNLRAASNPRKLLLYMMCSLVSLLSFPFVQQAQANSIPYRLYTIADGLPHENIQAIEQTPDGRLWVGTSAGLSYYTGSNFIPVRFLEARSTVNILEIEPLQNDDVWVATEQLGVWQVRYQHAVQPIKELAQVRASRLIERGDTLYVYGREAVWHVSLKDQSAERIVYQFAKQRQYASFALTFERPEVVSADFARDGAQWVLDKRRGPGRLMPDGMIQFLLDEDDEGWYALRFDEQGMGWASHEEIGLFRFNPQTGEMDLVIEESGIRHICITPMMIVLSSSNRGALYWHLMKDMLMPPMNEASGLPTSRVNCMYRDHEGNGWIGTQIGLIHMSHPGVKHMMEVDDRPLLDLNAVYNDKDKSLWASSGSQGLFQLYPSPRSVQPAGEERWTDLFRGHDDELYALGGSGWFTYKGDGEWSKIQAYASGFHGDVDKQGTGYFWHPDGVYVHRRGWPAAPIYRWPVEEKDYHRQTLSRDGRVIVWANGQLVQLKPGKSTGKFSEVEVIRDVSRYSNTAVKDVVFDHLGRAWVALLRNGLLCVDEDTTMQLLPGYHIEDLSLEGDSLLIANASEGLFVFNLPPKMAKEANAAGTSNAEVTSPAGTKKQPHLNARSAVRYHLTQSDGLMSSIVSGAVFTDGFLWVTHPGGVSQIPLRLLKKEMPVPQVFLSSINYNGIARSPYRQLDLKSSDRNIGFEFSATTFSHQHKVHYRYRLLGQSQRWQETEKPYVHFAKLPAGEYEFEVQASTSDYSFGEAVSYDFEIPLPYYQQPIFWIGILVLLTILFYYLHLYRLRSILQVERTRTQIAMDLHDDIGSSLTSLSFMSNLAIQRTEDRTPREEISPLLQEIGSMSSELVDNMLDIVWSVDPKQDSVGSVISRLQAFYQRLNDASEISVFWKVDDDVKKIALPPRSRRNLYLILKEAINNAIKYSGASKIDVAMTQDLVMLHVIVQDYGNGFNLNEVKSGYGLRTMKERAEESGAEFEIRSSVGSSTTIYIKWPLRKYAS